MKIKMLPESSSIIPAKLETVRHRLERWRRSHKIRSRIPEEFWESAVKLARQFGLAKTARILHLDYYALRKRCESVGCRRSPKRSSPAFVELIPPVQNAPDFLAEFEYPGGVKMRFQFNGKNRPDFLNLAASFGDVEE